MKGARGFSIIEILIVVAISGLLASAFIQLFFPSMVNYLYFPDRQNVQLQGMRLVDTVIDGDAKARGLRYAAPSPRLSTNPAITAATPNSISYTYFDANGTAVAVDLTYDAAAMEVTRAIDGGAAENIPLNFTAGSAVDFVRLENNNAGNPAFFHYYTSAGTEFVPANTAASRGTIFRVQTSFRARSGTSGDIRRYQGTQIFKSGVEIKDFRDSSGTL